MPHDPALWEELARAGMSPDQLFRSLAENSADVLVFGRTDGTILWVSEPERASVGWTPGAIIGTNVADHLEADDLAELRARVAAAGEGAASTTEVRVRTAEGGVRWMSARVFDLGDGHDGTRWRVASLRDVDRQHRAIEALELSEERLRSAMAAAPIAMAVVDLDRRFVAVNPALCRMLGRDEASLLTCRVPDLLDPIDNEADLRVRAELLHDARPTAKVEKRLRRADGTTVWTQHVVAALRDAHGVATGYVSQWLDITDSVLARDRLHFQATHDALTQVQNREDLDRCLGEIARSGTTDRTGLLFIDLDHLKDVNDTHGHVVGDQVLVQVARRISHATRQSDVVARFGGDEFVVVLADIGSLDDVRVVAENIVRSMQDPITLEGEAIPVSVSVGVTVTEPGQDPRLVLHHADTALYDAKRGGRGRVAVHAPPTIP